MYVEESLPLKACSVCVCHDVPLLGCIDKAENLHITSTPGLRHDIQSDCMPGSCDITTVEVLVPATLADTHCLQRFFFLSFSPCP